MVNIWWIYGWYIYIYIFINVEVDIPSGYVKIAIEHEHEIASFPINSMVIFKSYIIYVGLSQGKSL